MGCHCGSNQLRSATATTTVDGDRYTLSYQACQACGRIGYEALAKGLASMATGNQARTLFQRLQAGEPPEAPRTDPAIKPQTVAAEPSDRDVKQLVSASKFHPYKYLFGQNRRRIRAIKVWTGSIAYQACPDLGVEVTAEDPLKAWSMLYQKLLQVLDLPAGFVFSITCAPPFNLSPQVEPPSGSEEASPAPGPEETRAPAGASHVERDAQMALF